MSLRIAVVVLVFGGGAVLLIYLFDRLLRLRGTKDQSGGSQEHWVDPDVGIGGDD
jgi:hypothetical protein